MNEKLWPLIDIHNHLQDPEFSNRLDEVLDQATSLGIAGQVINGSEESDWERVLELCSRFQVGVPCLGLHPWYVSRRSPQWLQHLEKLLISSGGAIGEIGLDRWIEPRDETAQEEVFRAQLDLARRLNRPAMIHCLRAWGWMMDVLQSEPPLPAGMLFHAFGGPAELIAPLIERGAYFSFGGNVLEGKRLKMQAALKAIPVDRLLVESDAPDLLPPHPYSPFSFLGSDGKLKNCPANLISYFPALARLRGDDPVSLSRQIWENSLCFLDGLFNRQVANPAA